MGMMDEYLLFECNVCLSANRLKSLPIRRQPQIVKHTQAVKSLSHMYCKPAGSQVLACRAGSGPFDGHDHKVSVETQEEDEILAI